MARRIGRRPGGGEPRSRSLQRSARCWSLGSRSRRESQRRIRSERCPLLPIRNPAAIPARFWDDPSGPDVRSSRVAHEGGQAIRNIDDRGVTPEGSPKTKVCAAPALRSATCYSGVTSDTFCVAFDTTDTNAQIFRLPVIDSTCTCTRSTWRISGNASVSDSTAA